MLLLVELTVTSQTVSEENHGLMLHLLLSMISIMLKETGDRPGKEKELL